MQNIYTRLINRNHPLPPDYVPENLVDIGIPFDTRPGDPKRLLEKKDCSRCPLPYKCSLQRRIMPLWNLRISFL